jgi:hypothetical protein
MSILCQTYATEDVARRAVQALTVAGVPRRDIWLLTGAWRHDVRREPVGSFYGVVAPDGPVGTFAGSQRRRWIGAGTFAGDPRTQRQGSFADTERDVIVVHERGAERARASGDPTVRRLLRRFGVDRDATAQVLDTLHAGGAVVLVDVSEIRPSEAKVRLDELAQVA